MIDIQQYTDRGGRNMFAEFFVALDGVTQARISIGLNRLHDGNVSNMKGVGAGIFELKFDFGPGYRVYCGKDGQTLVVLLCGGTKKRQNQDIERAQILWREYKIRKYEKE